MFKTYGKITIFYFGFFKKKGALPNCRSRSLASENLSIFCFWTRNEVSLFILILMYSLWEIKLLFLAVFRNVISHKEYIKIKMNRETLFRGQKTKINRFLNVKFWALQLGRAPFLKKSEGKKIVILPLTIRKVRQELEPHSRSLITTFIVVRTV